MQIKSVELYTPCQPMGYIVGQKDSQNVTCTGILVKGNKITILFDDKTQIIFVGVAYSFLMK